MKKLIIILILTPLISLADSAVSTTTKAISKQFSIDKKIITFSKELVPVEYHEEVGLVLVATKVVVEKKVVLTWQF